MKMCFYSGEKYRVEARRNEQEEWSTWTTMDDPNNIRKHLNRVEELGYETRVIDPKIMDWEKKVEEGYLLFTPVPIGQTVYAVVPASEKFIVEEWEVKSLRFDGNKWYAGDGVGQEYEVRSQRCVLARAKAYQLAKELCKKSGCHHKCHDTKDCVVEDEAKEVIANSATTTEKHFTPSEVRKMTPKEVRENYDLIIQSMKYWK